MSSVADGLPLNKRLPAVIAISLGIGMATLDTAIVNTALPTLAQGIGTDSASVIWVVNAYQLAIIATVLPFASLSDVLGHRRVYLGGLLLFIVSSLLCGLAGSLVTLTAARVAQGLGAAAIMSVNTALLRHIYPSTMLGRGLGYNSLVVGLAFTLGPTAASAILSVASWHWLYLINVPLGLLALGLGLRSLPTLPMTGHAFDRLAALLCAGLFALLVLGLGTAVHGAQCALTLGLVAVALVCGGVLLRRQAGHPAPMLALDLFKRPVFALSSLTAICACSAQGLAFVSLPFLLQAVLGHSQVETGFLMTPWPAVVAVMALVAGRLADRVSLGLLCRYRPVDVERGHGGDGDVGQWRVRLRYRLAHGLVRRRFRLLSVAQPQGVDDQCAVGAQRWGQWHRGDFTFAWANAGGFLGGFVFPLVLGQRSLLRAVAGLRVCVGGQCGQRFAFVALPEKTLMGRCKTAFGKATVAA